MRSKFKYVYGLIVFAFFILAYPHLSHSATITYTYDNLNRLTKVVYGDGTIEEFSYDAAGNRLIYKVIFNDTTPPSPNPMTWATAPYATGISSIAMVATTAIDPSSPISYFFIFTDSPTGGTGGADSGWQQEAVYTNFGLEPNHQYGFRVKARDGANNETAYSNPIRYAYTTIETPSGITFGNITSTSIQVRSVNTPSGLNRGNSGLLIENITNGTNSGWKQNNDYWNNDTLSPNKSYFFRAKARNGDGIETNYSQTFSKYTLANLPGSAPFSNITPISIQANWTSNGNPEGTEYFCENVTLGTNSGWINSTYWKSTGLFCETSYIFRLKARNGEGVETEWKSLGVQNTLNCAAADENPPETVIISGPSGIINSGHVSFTFTGTDNVTSPANLVYATYLQGYDSGWSNYNPDNFKTYSGLPDGSYIFYVKAKDEAGNEDPSPAARPFTVQNIYKISCSDSGIPCIERLDGDDDSTNLVNGKPKFDVRYEFRIQVQDTGGIPAQVKLYMTQRNNPTAADFYSFDMNCTGNYEQSATCTYQTILGAAAVHKFYFEAEMSNGATIRYPSDGYIEGPRVYLLEGKNLVGLPRDLRNTNLDGQQAFGKSEAYRWDNSLSYFTEVVTQKPIKEGEGYFIAVNNSNSTLLEQSNYSDVPGVEYKITLNAGWNLISNPYAGNVMLSNVKIQRGNDTPVSWEEAVNRGWVVNALHYYEGEDWGDTYSNISAEDGATLIPWVGYWLYLNATADVYSLIIPKP